jgi:putative flippase GtrA
MPATALSRAELRAFLRESWRYGLASALALAADVAVYVALLRLGGVHYLLAAPLGFLIGLGTIYFLSARWAFSVRRYADARVEFALFALIGLAGLALNQAAIYAGVTRLALSPEAAKLVSAALVFCFNFSARKLLLFTRYGGGA